MSARLVLLVGVLGFISACGGGGGGSSSAPPPVNTPPPPLQSDFSQGIFAPAANFKDLCLNPRPNSSDSPGVTADENYWLRSWSNDTYLWYDEIVDEDPELYGTLEYFELMKTFATTSSGAPRDEFHFAIDTEEWILLSESGIAVDYGAHVVLVSTAPPREAVVAYVVPGAPADQAGIGRGDRILQVDGVDLVNGNDIDTLAAGLFPALVGESHTFLIETVAGEQQTVSLSAQSITEDPVPLSQTIDTDSGTVGYLVFNSHIHTAEERLVNEFQALATAGITDLVLDLRYNGGGLLDVASEVGFMIAGPAAAGGRVFTETLFNDKHPTTDPVTGEALVPTPFHQVAQGFSVTPGTDLPSVNLSRVFILSTEETCSASESIINGLRGIGINVVLIGEDTCGKPYGFYPTDNCGTTYFSTQFRGVNEMGFGEYAEGFVPIEAPPEILLNSHEVNGCGVADDFTQALGNEAEGQLAAALTYIDTQACPIGAASQSGRTVRTQAESGQNSPGGELRAPPRMPGWVM